MTRLGRLFVFLFSVAFTTMVLNGTAVSVAAGIAAVILGFLLGAGFGRRMQQHDDNEQAWAAEHKKRMDDFR